MSFNFTIKTPRNLGHACVDGLATIGWTLVGAVLFMASGLSAAYWLQRVLLGVGN